MKHHHQDIRIGTIVRGVGDIEAYLNHILPLGFECVQIVFSRHLEGVDLAQLADRVRSVLDRQPRQIVVSSLGIYGNPLVDEGTAADWKTLLENVSRFGTSLVCGFAGRVIDRPIPDSMPDFRRVFAPLAQLAEDIGARIAFENCDMGGDWNRGDWNIAHSPKAWEMMFEEVPSKSLGLEWEPCHQMVSLIDPLPQLRQWVDRVFHLHGKDATVLWDVVKTRGIRGGTPYVYHRTPGFGDTNWTDIISTLRMHGFRGAIDIEGWHDPVYRDELEMTGQVHALRYLQACRGGDFHPNPA